jgi:hypothetical protein
MSLKLLKLPNRSRAPELRGTSAIARRSQIARNGELGITACGGGGLDLQPGKAAPAAGEPRRPECALDVDRGEVQRRSSSWKKKGERKLRRSRRQGP